MRRAIVAVVTGLAAALAARQATAQAAATVPLPAFDPAPLVQQVSDFQTSFITHGDQGVPLAQRIHDRNVLIRSAFAHQRQARADSYSAHVRGVDIPVSCHSNHGGHSSCPGDYQFGDGYAVFSVGDSQSHFHRRASVIDPHRPGYISWNFRSPGHDRVQGHVWAAARYTPAATDRMLDAERDAVRQILAERHLPDDRAPDVS